MVRYSRQQRQAYLRQWKQSGLTQHAFCNQAGIKFSSFKYWRKHERIDNMEPEVSRLVPVQLVGREPTGETLRLTLHIRRGTLEIPAGFPAEELRNILSMLGE